MISVIFVCLGNICRSPLAESIFKKLVKAEGLESKISCNSAGTSDYHLGHASDPRTIEIAMENNIKIDHLATQFSLMDARNFDYIVAMDESNYNDILKVISLDKLLIEKLLLMREFDDDKNEINVPDPYFGGAEGFQNMYNILLRSCRGLLSFLREKHKI